MIGECLLQISSNFQGCIGLRALHTPLHFLHWDLSRGSIRTFIIESTFRSAVLMGLSMMGMKANWAPGIPVSSPDHVKRHVMPVGNIVTQVVGLNCARESETRSAGFDSDSRYVWETILGTQIICPLSSSLCICKQG